MNREAADTHLRLLAEAELRGAAAAGPWTVDRSDASFARVTRVARALSDVHALDAEAAEAILADFAAALGVRKGSGQGRLMMRYSASLSRLSRAPWFAWPTLGSPDPAEPAGPGSSGPAGLSGAARLAPLGLTLWYDHDGMDGELHLLSYCRTASGAQFAVAWRSVPGGGHQLPAGLFGVTDDRGARYAPSFAGCGGPDWAGEIRLHPVPPDDVRWFDFAPPGGPALRVHVQPDIAPDDSGLLVRQTDLGPGEHLLNQMAVRLLVTAHDFPPGLRPGAVPTATFAGIAAGLGDVVTALEAAEALSPVSPAPGRLAALCASLRVTGHGITAPPSHDLPEPWLSLLSHYHRRKPDPAPVWDGFAAAAAALPELDGIGLALLGLHTSEGRTVVHLRASGRDGGAEPPGPDLPLSVWVRDSGGRWHAAEQVSWSHDGCQSTFTMRLVPPLTRSSPWIELVAAGRSAEVRARLPLRWGSGHD